MSDLTLRSPARRRRSRVAVRIGGAFILVLLSLGACIVDEHDYDQHLDRCTNYCNLVANKCTGENAVYDYPEACMPVCKLMDLGQPALGQSDGNTVACRVDLLNDSEFNAERDCLKVGPGGGDACGSNCEAFCKLRQQVCTGVDTQTYTADLDGDVDGSKCLANCAAVPDLESFHANGRDKSGDSIQCRLVHVSEASVSPERAAQHCPHTQTVPKGINPFPCWDDATLSIDANCDRYCEQVTNACTGPLAVYSDAQQCNLVCHLLPLGDPNDEDGNSVRCRRFHSYNALGEGPDDATIHCTHAGPTGDGHCGSNCESYCTILSAACKTQFEQTFAGADQAARLKACQSDTECGALPGHSTDAFQTFEKGARYQVSPAPAGDNLLCRTYHAVTALSNLDKTKSEDATECAAAFGAGPCAP